LALIPVHKLSTNQKKIKDLVATGGGEAAATVSTHE
jgi:hypothetical protein